MSTSRVALFLALTAFHSLKANAALIDINPALFAPGTDISDAFSGVKLSNIFVVGNEDPGPEPYAAPLLQRGAIYSTLCSPCFAASDGRIVFGHGAGEFEAPVFWYSNYIADHLGWPLDTYPSRLVTTSYNAFLAEFEEPTSYVELIAGGAPMGNYTRVDLWAQDGSHIATCSNDGGGGEGCAAVPTGESSSLFPWTFTFTATDRQVAFLTAGGWAGTQYVHSMKYQVPEPGPASLLLIALGLAALTRRHKASASRSGN